MTKFSRAYVLIGGDSPESAQNLMSTYESNPSAFEDAQNLLKDYISGTAKPKKRQTVPLERIPKDLRGAAGQEYLRKLDAGELI